MDFSDARHEQLKWIGWLLELIRCRAGESADFEVEACNAKGVSLEDAGLV